MRERPIPFSVAMVRAILAGTKTQTRRVVKEPGWATHNSLHLLNGQPWAADPYQGDREVACPYGAPGDRLWVREAWRVARKYDAIKPSDLPPRTMTVEYEAGGYACNSPWNAGEWTASDDITPRERPEWVGKLRPGMFMPRWASRITLEITAVRVERLQDISEADAIAEGCNIDPAAEGEWRDNRDQYRELWESINGPGSWDANPWVWVVEFRRVDAARAEAKPEGGE